MLKPLRRPRLTLLLPLLAPLAAGCAFGESEAYIQARRGVADTVEGALLAPAESSLAAATRSMEASGLRIDHDFLYLDRARLLAAEGDARLRAGNRAEAARLYASAIDAIQAGDRTTSEAFVETMRAHADFQQFMARLSMVAGALNAAQPSARQGGLLARMNSDLAQRSQEAQAEMHGQAADRTRRLADATAAATAPGRPATQHAGPPVRAVVVSGPAFHLGRVLPGSCSGSLVGHRLFLTTQSCLMGEDGRPRDVASLAIAFTGIWRVDQVRVTAIHGPPGPVPRAIPPERDWAILVLDRHPVGRGFNGYAVEGRPPPALALARHDGELDDRRVLLLEWGCAGRRQGGLIATECQGGPHALGGPFLAAGGVAEGITLGLHAVTPPGGTPRGPAAAAFAPTLARLRQQTGLADGGPYPPTVGWSGGVASFQIPQYRPPVPGICAFAGRFMGEAGILDVTVRGGGGTVDGLQRFGPGYNRFQIGTVFDAAAGEMAGVSSVSRPGEAMPRGVFTMRRLTGSDLIEVIYGVGPNAMNRRTHIMQKVAAGDCRP
jgi:hypothetical protein